MTMMMSSPNSRFESFNVTLVLIFTLLTTERVGVNWWPVLGHAMKRINVYIFNRPWLSVASSAGHIVPAARSHGQADDAVARFSEAGALLA
jgi:hypothetical protein